jgi:hypothetical protein
MSPANPPLERQAPARPSDPQRDQPRDRLRSEGPLHDPVRRPELCLNEELPIQCPVQEGSVQDRLSRWCDRDSLQQEDAVLEALACCREILHALPDTIAADQTVSFPVGQVATLVCAAQSHFNQSGRCAD